VAPSDLAEVDLILGAKRWEAGGSGEGLVHPVAKHDDLRGPRGEQRFEVLDVALGAEPVADLVTRPREAADAEFFIGVSEVQSRLEVTGFEQALDHPATVEKKAVARA